MILKTGISILLSTLILALSSNLAMAVEKTGSSSSIAAWPLVLFVVIVIILRKKIFAEATPEPDHQEPEITEAVKQDSTKQESIKQKVAQKEPAKTKQKTTKPQATKKATSAKKTVSKKKATANSTIDLTDDSKQCQASTVKGTRCKRTTTLENISTPVDGKTYQLTVCSQHNNDKLKIFSELL